MKCTQQTILLTLAFAKYYSDDLDNFGNTSFMHIITRVWHLRRMSWEKHIMVPSASSLKGVKEVQAEARCVH